MASVLKRLLIATYFYSIPGCFCIEQVVPVLRTYAGAQICQTCLFSRVDLLHRWLSFNNGENATFLSLVGIFPTPLSCYTSENTEVRTCHIMLCEWLLCVAL